jgi:cell division protein FtsQ
MKRPRSLASGACSRVCPEPGARLPGMPLEMQDPDGDDATPKSGRFRARARAHPWWRPASTWGACFSGSARSLVLGGLALRQPVFSQDLSGTRRALPHRRGRNIEATGLTEVSRAEMLPVFGEDIGRNIFFVPIGLRRKQLEAIPWVERATVMRVLPDQIRVNVVERQPVAFTRQGSRLAWSTPTEFCSTMPAATMAAASLLVPGAHRHRSRRPAAARARRAWRSTSA